MKEKIHRKHGINTNVSFILYRILLINKNKEWQWSQTEWENKAMYTFDYKSQLKRKKEKKNKSNNINSEGGLITDLLLLHIYWCNLNNENRLNNHRKSLTQI